MARTCQELLGPYSCCDLEVPGRQRFLVPEVLTSEMFPSNAAPNPGELGVSEFSERGDVENRSTFERFQLRCYVTMGRPGVSFRTPTSVS